MSLQADITILASNIWQDADMIFPNIGELPSITFELKATKTAGYITRRDQVITYNLAYCFDIEEYSQIVAHELAHAIQFRIYPDAKQAHGGEFRYILKQLGYDTATYHSYSSKKAAKNVTPKNSANLLADML